MKLLTLAVFLVSLVSLAGCAYESDALKMARAETDAAKAELVKVKAEADAAKSELALVKAQLARANSKPALLAEDAVAKIASDFFLDLSKNRLRSAYDYMSADYKKRVERKAFDDFIEKHPGLASFARDDGFGRPQTGPLKVRKAKDNAFECDCKTSYIRGGVYISTFSVRLVQEEGAWKIDDFLEINDRKQ